LQRQNAQHRLVDPVALAFPLGVKELDQVAQVLDELQVAVDVSVKMADPGLPTGYFQ
jgi:hypothetical protein